MKKILIIGAAGFLMSNFIRYVLYRSKKEFEMVSVDVLNNISDVKNIYLNRHNKFYIGDVTNENFMDRVIKLEKPDIIINGAGAGPIYGQKDILNHAKLLLESSYVLTKYGIPIVQLSQPEESDACKIYSAPNHNILTAYYKNNAILEIPNCFGPRQSPLMGLGKIITSVINSNKGFDLQDQWPWAFSEDVCSLIWYIIETQKTGKIKMPPLGMASLKDLSNIVKETLDIKNDPEKNDVLIQIKQEPYKPSLTWAPKCINYKPFNIDGWIPDSKDLRSSVVKTVIWYSVNKWIMKG